MNSVKKRAKRDRLFSEQEGKCFYCKCQMIKVDGKHFGTNPPNLATFEHLDGRFSKERGLHQGERRVVLACHSCNQQKGREQEVSIEVLELRIRSRRLGRWGRRPLTKGR